MVEIMYRYAASVEERCFSAAWYPEEWEMVVDGYLIEGFHGFAVSPSYCAKILRRVRGQ